MYRRDYLILRLFMSGFENVYQNNAAPIAQSAEHTSAMRKPQAMVSVPSERIVRMAHNDSGIAQSSWKKTRWPLSEKLHHLKNLVRSIPVIRKYSAARQLVLRNTHGVDHPARRSRARQHPRAGDVGIRN